VTSTTNRRARRGPPRGGYYSPIQISEGVSQLSLRQTLFLLALIEGQPSSSTYHRSSERLAPHWRFTEQILRELADCRAISISRAADAPSTWMVPRTSPLEVDWTLSPSFAATLQLQDQLETHAKELSRADGAADELFTLWRELAISEAVGYLSKELTDHRFDENWTMNAVPALERGLRHLSVSQTFYFCWMSVREAASRYLRFPGSTAALSESLVTYLEQRLNRALTDGWKVRDWSTASHRVPTSIAIAFSTRVTHLGDSYMTRVPSREWVWQKSVGSRTGSVR